MQICNERRVRPRYTERMSRAQVTRDDFNDNLCKALRRAKETEGYTLVELEQKTGLKERHISRIMCSQRAVTASELVLLADALNMRLMDLVMQAKHPEDWTQK